MAGRTYAEIKRQEARDKVRDILADRWSLDEEEGWKEFGEATLDDIEAAYVPLMLVPPTD